MKDQQFQRGNITVFKNNARRRYRQRMKMERAAEMACVRATGVLALTAEFSAALQT